MSDGPWTVTRMRRWLKADLAVRDAASAGLTADLVIAHALGVGRTALYLMDPGTPLAAGALATIRAAVVRLRSREPVQYVLGAWPFRGMDLDVDASTLIPRGATGCVIDACLRELARIGAPEGGVRMLDIGTGTGCIALAVLREAAARRRKSAGEALPWSRGSAVDRPSSTTVATIDLEGNATCGAGDAVVPGIAVVATDIVAEALELAKGNAARAKLAGQVEFRQGSLWDPVRPGERFHLIVSNPPYIADDEWSALAPEVRDHEPATALRGGADGLQVIRPLIAGAPQRLHPGGALVVEFGTGQGERVEAIARAAGLAATSIHQDEDGHPRALVARDPSGT